MQIIMSSLESARMRVGFILVMTFSQFVLEVKLAEQKISDTLSHFQHNYCT